MATPQSLGHERKSLRPTVSSDRPTARATSIELPHFKRNLTAFGVTFDRRYRSYNWRTSSSIAVEESVLDAISLSIIIQCIGLSVASSTCPEVDAAVSTLNVRFAGRKPLRALEFHHRTQTLSVQYIENDHCSECRALVSVDEDDPNDFPHRWTGFCGSSQLLPRRTPPKRTVVRMQSRPLTGPPVP